MRIDFAGRTVAITGAARGIGSAIATGFAERGAVVWACSIERTALRRLGKPEAIAYAAMFLASPYAGFISGQVLPVTGGPQA